MPNIRKEILNGIGNKTVTTDELHDFIKSQLSDTYEIGDAGVIINEMVAEELLIANDFEVSRKGRFTNCLHFRPQLLSGPTFGHSLF